MKRLFMVFAFLCGMHALPLCAKPYIDNGNGTVTDVATWLTWQQGESPKMYWASAMAYCTGLSLGGQSNWRMPNVVELLSLVDRQPYPENWIAIDRNYFPNAEADSYWTSTFAPYAPPDGVSVVNFSSGWHYDDYSIYNIFPVRCVGGQVLGILTVSPSVYDFGGVSVGDHSSNWFTVSNKTRTPLTISAVNLKGTNPQDFYLSDACSGSTLSPGQQCRTGVSFWPSAKGPRQALLQVTAGSVITTTATLTGSGGLSADNSILSGKITTDAGAALGGASISMGLYATTSGGDGSYSIYNIAPGDYTIDLSKSGYATYQRPVSIPPATSVIQNMSLAPSSGSTIKVNSITSKYNGFLYFLSGTDFTITFTANIDWGGHPPQMVRFVTSTGTYDVTTSTDSASQSFNVGLEFAPCTTLSAVAFSSDGTQSALKQADFTMMSPLPVIVTPLLQAVDVGSGFFYHTTAGFNFNVINEKIAAGVIPKDFPLFGQDGFSLRMVPTIDAKVKMDGTATIGLELKNKPELSAKIAGFECKLNEKVDITGKFSQTSCNYDWGGSAGFAGNCEIFKTWPFIFMAGPVPVPIYSKAAFKLSADATGTVHNIYPFDYALNAKLVPTVRGSLGVGVDSNVAIEGWIGGGATVGLQYPLTPHLNKFTLFMDGGVTIYAFLWKWEDEALRWDWDLSSSLVSPQGATSAPLSPATPIAPKLVARNYLLTPTSGSFLIKPKLSLSIPSSVAPQVVTSSGVIQAAVFPYAEAHLSSTGPTGLAWVTDKAGRTAMNRTMAVSSFRNGSAWSSPQPISDDGTADFHPWIVTFPDGSSLAAWENEKVVQPDSALFDDMLKNLEISAARYNPASGQWTDVTRLTSNSYLDRSPKIAGPSASNAVVTWLANQASSLTGSSAAPNILLARFHNGTAWGAPLQVARIAQPIVSYDLSYDGTTAQVLLALDTDGDPTTITDHELYQVTVTGEVPGALTRLTNDTLPDDSPHMTRDGSGNPVVIWLRGDQLVSAPLSDIATQTVIYSDEYSSNLAAFSLARSASGRISLTWQEPTALNPSDLFGIFYDPTTMTWSAPRQLTSDPETERGIATAFTGPDTLMAVYNRNITGPDPGLSDLYMVNYSLGADLALQEGSLEPSPQTPQPGQPVTFTVTALNPGDKAAGTVPVAFYNGDPAAGGVLLGQTVIPQVLKPGDAVDVTFDWTMPQGTAPLRIYGVIDPASAFDTTTRANNTVYCDLVKPDLAVQTTSFQMITSTLISVTARVINKGSAPAGATTATFRNDTATGTIISTATVPALGIGGSVDLNIQMDISANPLSYYTIFMTVDEGNTIAELDKTNNTATIIVAVDGSCSYALGSPSTTVPAAGGPYSLAITTNSPTCTWKAISNDAWVTLPGTVSGAGSGTLPVAAAPNPLGAQRLGTITVASQTFTVIQDGRTYSIGLAFQGAAGSVTTMPGAACAANCAVNISAGEDVTLYPSGNCSYFTGWGGACAGQSTFCALTMTADMLVAAAFTAYPDVWNKSAKTGDASIQNVYLNASDGAVLELQAKSFNESPMCDRPVSVTLSPGYDCDYSTDSGVSTIKGLTISKGRVILSGGLLTIQ